MSDAYRVALRPADADAPDRMDDVVVKNVSMFRAEMMSDTEMWMACYFPDSNQEIRFWVRATRRKGEKLALEFTVTDRPTGSDFTYEGESK